MSEDLRLVRVALSLLVEPGNWRLWEAIRAYGPVVVLDQLLAGAGAQLWKTPVESRLAAGDPRERAAEALLQAERLGARVVIPEDAEWPRQLDDLSKIRTSATDDPTEDAAPPLCLWARGPQPLNQALAQAVAVVGARAATGYGAHLAREFGYGLADRGWTVVSGGAFGIDAGAHRGALAAGGLTVAVLACGVERAYPVSHANLFDRIAEDGLVLSEWPPGSDPFRHRFLIRNRVIAAAARGTVMVEANARSGARHTLRRAGELGRARMVVPGPVTSAMSVGCHLELRELRDPPVRLVTGVSQVLEEIGQLGADLAPVPWGPEQPRDRLRPVELRLVEALLKRKPLGAEEVAARAGVAFAEAVRILPGLVSRGFAQRREHGFVVAPAARGPSPAGGAAPSPASDLAASTTAERPGAAA